MVVFEKRLSIDHRGYRRTDPIKVIGGKWDQVRNLAVLAFQTPGLEEPWEDDEAPEISTPPGSWGMGVTSRTS